MFLSKSLLKLNLIWLIFLFTINKVRAQDIYYLHQDNLGSNSVITKQDQSLAEIIDYYPYGQIRFNQSFSKHQEKRKFINQQYDDQTKLQYLNARYYDPILGKFIGQDDNFWHLNEEYLIDPQQQNSYAYARDNPIIYCDPFGFSRATYNIIPSGGWRFGQNMGQFNGVVAYYNGIGSSKTTYSCVEYAKRYQSQVYNINSIGIVGDAKTMWTMVDKINERLVKANSDYTFTKQVNGQGFNLPTEGDLLFWTEGKYGHVMVATESNFNEKTNKGYVEIIDQNTSQQAVRKLDVKKTDSGYVVMKNDNTPIAGWFKPTPINNNIKNNIAPVKNNSLPNGFWSKFKQWAKNTF